MRRDCSLLLFTLIAVNMQFAAGLFGFGGKATEEKLYEAAESGDGSSVKTLLSSGAKPDKHVADDGSSALILASETGHCDIMYALLTHGAVPDLCRKDGASPLMGAAAGGHVDAVNLLLDQGASPNLQDNNGASALMFASDRGHTHVVQLLLHAGAHPDIQNKVCV